MSTMSNNSQWTPTTERLPDPTARGDDHWIVIAPHGELPRMALAEWDGMHGYWERNGAIVAPADVSHWQPVQPPELP